MSAKKILVCGAENSGKSTVTSKLSNTLVFNFDRKQYTFPVPHVNLLYYTGMSDLIALIQEKVSAYVEKVGHPPTSIVFDTVTQLYSLMEKFNSEKYKGFEVHSTNKAEIVAFNEFLNSIVEEDIDVVIVAHTVYDKEQERFIIPATGAFANSGSWLSLVNDSIFVEKKSNDIVVHLKSFKLPARTTLDYPKDSLSIKEFSIQEFLDAHKANQENVASYGL